MHSSTNFPIISILFSQHVYVVGGHISSGHTDKGNLFSVPSNKYAEFNMFLDPLAAKAVFESTLDIMLIPLGVQRNVSSFSKILETMSVTKRTAESRFALRLVSRLHRLKQLHGRYQHMVKLLILELSSFSDLALFKKIKIFSSFRP